MLFLRKIVGPLLLSLTFSSFAQTSYELSPAIDYPFAKFQAPQYFSNSTQNKYFSARLVNRKDATCIINIEKIGNTSTVSFSNGSKMVTRRDALQRPQSIEVNGLKAAIEYEGDAVYKLKAIHIENGRTITLNDITKFVQSRKGVGNGPADKKLRREELRRYTEESICGKRVVGNAPTFGKPKMMRVLFDEGYEVPQELEMYLEPEYWEDYAEPIWEDVESDFDFAPALPRPKICDLSICLEDCDFGKNFGDILMSAGAGALSLLGTPALGLVAGTLGLAANLAAFEQCKGRCRAGPPAYVNCG